MTSLSCCLRCSLCTPVAMLLLLMILPPALAGADCNMFHRPVDATASDGNAFGTLLYNMSRYRPSCGWKIVLTSSFPLCAVEFWNGVVDQVDAFTFVLTNHDYMANNTGLDSNIHLNGLFGSIWPSVTANYLCVCNLTTLNICQVMTENFNGDVHYETEPRNNYVPSPTPCPPSSGQVPTATLPSTASQLAASTTPGPPALTPADIYRLSQTTVSSSIKLNVTYSSCYVGALYTPLPRVTHFVDCCALCVGYPACRGVNYRPGSKQCDLITESASAAGSTLFNPSPDCSYWQVIYRR